jgi:hypothetical protein
MSKKGTRKVYVLKHGRGKVHELDCRWLGRHTDWTKYEEVSAAKVAGRPHCRHCL